MFDIGFWELIVVGIVALLVLGPERLPEVARTAGFWLGRMRRFVANVKGDIEQDLRLEEWKRTLHEPGRYAAMQDVQEILEETAGTLQEVGKELQASVAGAAPQKQPISVLAAGDSGQDGVLPAATLSSSPAPAPQPTGPDNQAHHPQPEISPKQGAA
jgi:sec-independent protein translocase protein TatB